MGTIILGKNYPTLKCDKCGKNCKEYSSYIVKKDEVKSCQLERGKRICMNCVCSLPPDPKEEARIKKLDAQWEKEMEKKRAIGRKRAQDPKWRKKLQDRMMSAMMKDITK